IGPQFHKISVSSLHDLSQLLQHYSNFILIAEAQWLINQKNRWLDLPQGNHFQNCYFIGLGESAFHLLEDRALQNGFAGFNILTSPFKIEQLEMALLNARKLLLSKIEANRLKETLKSQNQELRQLYDIGIALSAERNPDILLEMILKKSREITHADAGSLYLVETIEHIPENEADYFANKQLRFKLAHNDSVDIAFQEKVMPIERQSVAGYVALNNEVLNIPDVYDLPADAKFAHNKSFDQTIGYRTKSMLVIPMKTHKDEIIGVLQLINRKRHWEAKLTDISVIEQEVIPFDDKCVDLACSLASQAAISIENTRLYEEIKRLFEGFVRASVHAIEQRDPSTFGHSERVATLSVALAEKVDRVDSGKFKEIRFSRQDIQQIHYAALLHDFGKIGVREDVLVKAKKLFPHELDAVKNRFKIIKQATELRVSREKIIYLLKEERQKALALISALDRETRERIMQLDRYFQIICEVNEPTVLNQSGFEMLQQIGSIVFNDNGTPLKLLTSKEIEVLSIPKGSLSREERKEIESHVTHTFNFLQKIPWTSELKRVPLIAGAHHEKLDGSGYPHGWVDEQIPIESKIMTIADIFDALTAWDRPYKRAVPVEKALEIIQWEVNDGKVDGDLFKIFVDARLFELVKKPKRQ
ncbi:MAG: GAF domain-containing protein, partial [candidate division KSB1 bacterium]|nr:GAF domain-containing protein [candidate division KSB1 bacterium]